MSDYQTTMFGEPEPIGHHGYPIARKSDPETSKEAAEVFDLKSAKSCFIVGLHNCGRAATANEVAIEFDGKMQKETIRKRAKELVRDGFIEIVGERKCLDTGVNATTYKLTKEGRNEYDRLSQ